jgi:amino acid permease
MSQHNPFKIREAYDYAVMGRMLWGRAGQVLNTLVVVVYLMGVLVSRLIIIGTTMK